MSDIDISGLDIGAWEAQWDAIMAQSYSGTLTNLLDELASGNFSLDPDQVWRFILALFSDALKSSVFSYIAIIAVAFICSVIGIISPSDSAGGAGAFVCFGMGTAIAAKRLASLFALAVSTISLLCGCMDAIAPVLSIVIAASGGTGTAAVITPLAAFLSGTVASIFKNAVLPVCAAAGVCALIGAAAADEKLEHMFKLLKSFIRWLSGAVFTVYFGILAAWGLSTKASDSVAVKSAKYALDKGVPIVGGAMSGTMDSVLASAGLIKNAAGTAALITIAAAAALPLITIGCSALAARGTAAICGFMGDKRTPNLMERTADVANGLFAAVSAVAVMFMLTVGLAFVSFE